MPGFASPVASWHYVCDPTARRIKDLRTLELVESVSSSLTVDLGKNERGSLHIGLLSTHYVDVHIGLDKNKSVRTGVPCVH